jgi:hypothetical protein
MHLTGRLYGVLCLLATLLGFWRHPLMRRMAFPQLRPAKPPLLPPCWRNCKKCNLLPSVSITQAVSSTSRPQMRSSRVTHVVAGKSELEKLELLDGKPREFVRDNEEVASYDPEQRIVRRESGSPAILSRPSSMRARKTLPATIGCSPTAMSAWPAATARPSCWRRATSCATATVSAPTRPPACCCVHRRWMAVAR